jgi:hypothetical protein
LGQLPALQAVEEMQAPLEQLSLEKQLSQALPFLPQ